MKSLLIYSLPRSCTTPLYQTCVAALPQLMPAPGLASTRGELLNKDDGLKDYGLALPHFSKDPAPQLQELLFNNKENRIIKDVVQTQNVNFFLKVNKDSYNTLVIDRRVEDIVYCMFNQKWNDILRLVSLPVPVDEYELLCNLSLAVIYAKEKFIEPLKLPTLRYIDYISNEKYLYDILESFGYEVNRVKYIDNAFRDQRKVKLEQRGTPVYKTIESIVRKINDERMVRNFI